MNRAEMDRQNSAVIQATVLLLALDKVFGITFSPRELAYDETEESKEEQPMARKKSRRQPVDERDPAVVATQQAMNGDEPSNRKAIGYEHPPAEVGEMLDQAMTKWHVELVEAQVKVSPLFARAYDRHGEAIPAIKAHGQAVVGKIRITSLEDRVRGLGDAKLLIDGNRWERLGHNARLAFLDHQLEHLELNGDDLDDAGRPKLKFKHHDWAIAGFDEVAKRQGENSLEVQGASMLRERFAQLLLPFPGGSATESLPAS